MKGRLCDGGAPALWKGFMFMMIPQSPDLPRVPTLGGASASSSGVYPSVLWLTGLPVFVGR